MEIQTLIVVLIVLAAAGYVLRLFWRALRGARAGATEAAGCATGGCCAPAQEARQERSTTTGA